VDVEYDVIIIGSGITASRLRNKINSHYKCLTINPISNSQPFKFTDLDGLFSKDQADKGNSPGGIGAVEYWGGAITWPTVENYFKDASDDNWSEFRDFISIEELNREFNFQDCKAEKTRIRSIFPKNSVVYEKHGYLGGGRKHVRKSTNEIVSIYPHVNAEIQDIRHEANYELRINLDKNDKLETKFLRSKYLIFACGPLLNPLFYAMISGQKVFSYGNHLSLTTHTINFENIQTLGPWVQTYNHREEIFYTFLPKKMRDASNRISTRLRPREILSKKRTAVKIVTNPGTNCIFKVRNLLRIMFSSAGRRQIATEFTVDLMINQEPSFGSRLIVEDSLTPKRIIIDSRVDEKCLDLIREHIREMDLLLSEVSASGNNLKSIVKIDNAALKEKTTFRDAAHWYGTIPLNSISGLINQDFESKVFPNLFIVGASGFVEGSVGHPTLLAIYTSDKVAKELIRRQTK
jgi:hypothetical protein